MKLGRMLREAFSEIRQNGAVSSSTLRELESLGDKMTLKMRDEHRADQNNPHNVKMTDLQNDGSIHGVNLIKNYPSLELADATAPQWWTANASSTLTEEDATGEGINPAPNERVLKAVTTATLGGFYQSFTPANERQLTASDTVVSFGAWVYVVTAGTLTLLLSDSSGATSVTTGTSTTGSWVYLEVTGFTIGANNLLAMIRHDATAATFYVANPTLNVGSRVMDWRPRQTVYRYSDEAGIVTNADPTSSAYATGDATSVTSANTVICNFKTYYLNATTAPLRYLFMRPYFSTATMIVNESLTTATAGREIFVMIVDSQQRFSWRVSVGAGEVEHVYINIIGYWEWE